MRNASFNGTWLPIMDARQHTGGKSDHIWIVSVQERSGDVRGILCKGSKFPTFLPRPTLMVFPWGLPMCEMDTDKGKFEEICLKARIRHADLTVASAADTEGKYEETLGDIQKSELESIVKLFILACKAERDLRALDVARLMPNSKSIQALIDLAAKLRRRGLAEKLSDLAREKAAEEASKFPVESHLTESNGEVRQHRSQADNYANNVEDEDIERINSPVDYENSTAKHKPLNRAKIPADSELFFLKHDVNVLRKSGINGSFQVYC